MIEIALGLGNERALLALKLLLASDISKHEIKRFRDRIINLYDVFPDYVEQFGFRFKVKKLG
ncbi:hypothetical protein D3C85_1837220 [compost metagenome]